MKGISVGLQNAALLTAVFLHRCSPRPIVDRHWPDAYWHSGEYVLIAVDTEAQMSLAADVKDGGKIFLVNVVDATVFSIGANDRYIVTKQHPLVGESQTIFAREVTNYFVVDRTKPPTLREPQSGVTGPLTKEAFEHLAATRALPRFTKTFCKLEWQRTD